MAEAALIRLSTPPPPPGRERPRGWVYALGGVVLGAALVALGTLL